MKSIFFLTVSLFFAAVSYVFADDGVHKFNWDGVDVLHKKDQRLPLFEIQIFFSDGALSDPKGQYGLTELMFNHLRSGTNRLSKTQIDSALEYSAISMSSYVSHEYSVVRISGLMEHLIPATKLFCHLIKDANFPQREINKDVSREENAINNLVVNPSALTNRVFRKVNLSGSPYEEPVGGTLKSLKRIKAKDLGRQLSYFKEKVSKKFYLAGPEEVLVTRSIFSSECGFKFNESDFKRSVSKHQVKSKYKEGEVYFVPVEGLNQAQIRFGKYLKHHERGSDDILKNIHLMGLVSEYLGGGFSSLLNRELRIKRGLVYSVNAISSVQKDYGRSVILTSTRLDGVEEAIIAIKDVLNKTIRGEIDDKDFERTVNYLSGSFLFGLETNSSYLSQIMLLDHLGKDHEELFNFPSIIKSFTKEDVKKMTKEVFDPSEHVILITGPKSLADKLKKKMKVNILNYKDYL